MEKCRPTPNISRMTPISASCDASDMSPTNPGVNGPIITPASRYPTSGGRRRYEAIIPKANAKTKAPAMVAISAVSWGIALLKAGSGGI